MNESPKEKMKRMKSGKREMQQHLTSFPSFAFLSFSLVLLALLDQVEVFVILRLTY